MVELPLTSLERDALMHIAMRSSLIEPYRRVSMRLIHRGLVAQTSEGFKLTPKGMNVCTKDAQQRGLN